MTCPTCRTKTKVIDSREIKSGEVRRRHECQSGHRFTTLECVENFIDRKICEATGLRKVSIWTAARKEAHPWPCEFCGAYHLTPKKNMIETTPEI